MKLDYKHLLLDDFSYESRVWIYQASRLFTMSEALETEDMLNKFASAWQSHGTPVKGFGTLLFGQFIILMADESATGVSGCSTDSSVRLIKEIEQQFNINLFERTTLAFYIKEKIQLLPMNQLTYAVENNFIEEETLFFNNMVQTKKELEENWVIPIKNSWLAKRISFKKTTA